MWVMGKTPRVLALSRSITNNERSSRSLPPSSLQFRSFLFRSVVSSPAMAKGGKQGGKGKEPVSSPACCCCRHPLTALFRLGIPMGERVVEKVCRGQLREGKGRETSRGPISRFVCRRVPCCLQACCLFVCMLVD